MLRVVFLMIASMLLISGCARQVAVKDYQYHSQLRIPSVAKSKPPVTIAANMYLPRTLVKGRRYPAIIMPNSWGLDQYEYKQQARRFANHGYIVLSYSARGWEKSTGKVSAGGAGDMQDIHAIIDWLVKNTSTDPKRIGMLGISYGGGLSLLSAEHDSRIRAVASLSGWTDLLHSLYFNKTPSTMAANILVDAAKTKKARVSPLVKKYMQQFQNYKVSAAAKQWAMQRSPLAHVATLDKRHVSIYLSNNFEDILFNTGDAVAFYHALPIKNKRLDLNQGVHSSAEAGGLRGKDNYVWDQARQWFDHYLKGNRNKVTNGIYLQTNLDAKPIRHMCKAMHEKVLYPAPPASHQFGGLLNHEESKNAESTLVQGDAGINTGVSRFTFVELWRLLVAFYGGWSGPATFHLGLLDSRFGVLYLANTVVKDHVVNLLGEAKAKVWVKLTSRGLKQKHNAANSMVSGQLVAYLYDVDPSNNKATLISYGPHTFYKGSAPLNHWMYVTIPMRYSAYQLVPGHYLAVLFSTRDNLYLSPKDKWTDNVLELGYAHAGKDTKVYVPECS